MSAVIAFAGVHKSREAHRSGFCPEGVGASGGYDGCEAAQKQATSAVSGTPRPQFLLAVPDRSWTSPLPRPPARIKSRAVCHAERSALSSLQFRGAKIAVSDGIRIPVGEAHRSGFCPEGVGASGGYDGCEAAQKQATSAVSGTPRPPVLLAVPDRSWTSPLPRPPARIKSRAVYHAKRSALSSLQFRGAKIAVSGGIRIPVGADRATLRLFAKTVFQTTHFRRIYRPFREQCGSPPRSHGLRQESKAELCTTLSAQRGNDHR